MKTHEFADIFPMMDKKEYSDLKNDIKQNGLMESVITLDGSILDGRNRFRACEELGIKPTTKEFDGDDPLQYVMSTNLQRRNLNQSQKAMVGRRWKVHYSKYAKERQSSLNKKELSELVPEADKGKASDKAGEVAGVSGRYIDMAEEVISKRPEMEEIIMSGERKIKQVLREIHLEEQKIEISKLKPELEIIGKYNLIVMDPPWNYGGEYDPDNRRVTSPYPEMNQEQLLDLKLPDSENTILFLWTTHRFIWNAKELLEKWGYDYKCIITWDKEKMGVGEWVRKQCEFCLVAIKGKVTWGIYDLRDIIREPRTTHSTKPEIFYNLIDKYFKDYRKIDYFNKNRKRDGWDSWGNEI